MYCSLCGSYIPDDQVYCTNCGTPVAQYRSQPANPPVYQQSVQQQTAYQQPVGYNPPKTKPRNGFARAGLVLGIVSLCWFWFPMLNFVLCMLGVIFSIVGLIKKELGGIGVAIAGLAMSGVALILSVLFMIVLATVPSSSTDNDKNDSNATAENMVTQTIETTRETKELMEGTTSGTIQETTFEAIEEFQKEINPDIPWGTEYELGQGSYEVGEDIPAGRYRIEWIDGNTLGGSLTGATGKYIDSYVSINPDESYTCFFGGRNGL